MEKKTPTLVEYISIRINSGILEHGSIKNCANKFPDPEVDAYRCWLRKNCPEVLTYLNCVEDVSSWSMAGHLDYGSGM